MPRTLPDLPGDVEERESNAPSRGIRSVQMAERQRQGIRGVDRRRGGKPQEKLNGSLYITFPDEPVHGNGALDFGRRVFENASSRRRGGQEANGTSRA